MGKSFKNANSFHLCQVQPGESLVGRRGCSTPIRQEVVTLIAEHLGLGKEPREEEEDNWIPLENQE